MDKTLKIALILTAVDKMSGVITNATNQSISKIQSMQQKASLMFKEALVFGGAGAAGFAYLHKASEAFGELEDASLQMKTSMLQSGGILDQATFDKLDAFTNKLSAQLTGTAADYKAMVTVMQENGLRAEDILGGTGEAVAQLAVLFKMAPSSIGQFAARMKQDMGIANNEMVQMTDMVARLKNAGVGKTGEEAVMEMQEAFSKAGLGASNLGIRGVEAAKSLGSLMGIFIRRGISGSTVGNNFRRIFDGLRDIDKLKKSNEVAKQFGITLDFYDKKGNFKGIDNFIGQIGKLEGLGTQKTAAILKPFGGKQGLSTDFLEFLGKEGTKGFNEMQLKQFSQATQQQKLAVVLSGQTKQTEIAATSWKNAMALIGKTLEPLNIAFSHLKNRISIFIQENPRLAKFIAVFVGLSSTALLIMGVVKAFQALRIVMVLLKITMAANPFILIMMAAILVVTLVITYWDKIKPFFLKLWDSVKGMFGKAWGWIKNIILTFTPIGWFIRLWKPLSGLFKALWDLVKAVFHVALVMIKYVLLNFTPLGLIFKYWDKLAPYFTKIWDFVKGIFSGIVDFVWGIGKSLFDAGANIINSIIKGITSKIEAITSTVKNVTQKIRDFFPFSPAKTGPLTDIHKIKLVETIAASIKVNPIVKAMHGVGQAVFNANPGNLNRALPLVAASGGNNTTVHFNFNGVTGDIVQQVKSKQREIMGVLKEAQRQVDRTKF